MKEETLQLAEEVLELRLQQMKDIEVTKDEYKWAEQSAFNLMSQLKEMEKLSIDEADKLAQRECDRDRNAIEEADKMERREIERERNEMQAEIEAQKQRVSLPKVLFEMAKVTVPVLISGAIFAVVHRENMEFEETGTFHSSTGKSINNGVLNRFLKF